jgi:hypothetical protein
MARARNIKPSFFSNDKLGELEPIARLLFIGMWTIADFKGCFEFRPKRIKVQLLPYDNCDIEVLAKNLEDSGFILIYSVSGQRYISILNFDKHQNPHKNERDSGSEIPAPPENSNEINKLENIEKVLDKNGTAPAESLFLNPSSPFPLPECSASAPSATALPTPTVDKPKRKPPKSDIPVDFGISQRVVDWSREKGFGQLNQHLEAFKAKAKAKGYQYVDWDSAFMEAVREDWAKLRVRGSFGVAPPPESAATADPDSRASIEAEGIANGFGPWVELDEQFLAYKARVRSQRQAPPLTLTNLEHLAKQRMRA